MSTASNSSKQKNIVVVKRSGNCWGFKNAKNSSYWLVNLKSIRNGCKIVSPSVNSREKNTWNAERYFILSSNRSSKRRIDLHLVAPKQPCPRFPINSSRWVTWSQITFSSTKCWLSTSFLRTRITRVGFFGWRTKSSGGKQLWNFMGKLLYS